jgi:hypothetical protein
VLTKFLLDATEKIGAPPAAKEGAQGARKFVNKNNDLAGVLEPIN